MMRCAFVTTWAVMLWWTAIFAPRAAAAPPHESLLPASTVVFLHTPSWSLLQEKWRGVQYGKILADESMTPFREQWQQFLDAKVQGFHEATGLSVHEILQFASDGVSGAVLPAADGKAVYVVLAELGDRRLQAERLLAEADRRLTARGATRSLRMSAGVEVVEYRGKPNGATMYEAAYVVHDGLLCISTSVAATEEMLSRWKGSGDSLATCDAFQSAMDACGCENAEKSADGRAFVDPIGCLRVLHAASEQRLDRQDPIDFVTRHGFDAVRGLGGVLSLATEATDLTARLSIFAPRPYRGAMGMFQLPESEDFSPPTWLTDDVNMFAAVNIDLAAVLNHVGPLFDDVIGDGIEGTFNDILTDLAAEDGPNVDVRRDLFAHLGPRILLLNDAASADDPRSERSLVAIETQDEAAVALAIKKLLRDDPGVRRLRLAAMDHDLWQIGEDAGVFGGEGKSRKLTSSAVMVAHGHLLLATSPELIRKVVAEGRSSLRGEVRAEGGKLRGAEDLELLESRLSRYTPGPGVGRIYSRTASDLRATYELLRSGSTDTSESIPGMVAAKLLAATRDEKTGELAIDFTTLPPYRQIADRLGWIGITGKNTEDGWYVVGVALAPAAP